MYINLINPNNRNNRCNNKIAFGHAQDLIESKKMIVSLISEPETKKILESGNMVQIKKLLNQFNASLTKKILELNPGSRPNNITKETTLIYGKNDEYIGAISHLPSEESPIHIGYFDSELEQCVDVEAIPCEILGTSRIRQVDYKM